MSRYIVEKLNSKDLDGVLVKNYISIKYSDDRWKNFKPVVITDDYESRIEYKKDLNVYEDDVFLCTFPRSGTTLTQEIVWLILNDFDFKTAKAELLDDRFPELEYVVLRCYY